jgi:hypothetical protein
MTLEYSLRRRARRARMMAVLWLSLATSILVITYISLPVFANEVAGSISNIETKGSDPKAIPQMQLYTLGTLTLGVLTIAFSCFLLGRTAFVEIELAARFSGIADAFCIAGDDMAQLEKAVQLLVPSAKYLSVPGIFSVKDLQSITDLVKQVKT